MRLSISSLVVVAGFMLSISPAHAQTVQVKIELIDVNCGNTEDVTGADDFYIVSALSAGTDETSKSAVTKPFKINDGQTKKIAEDQRVLFDAKVPVQGTIRGGMKMFDEDYAKDWAKQKEMAEKATNAVSSAAEKLGGPPGVKAGAVLKAAFEVYNGIASLDKDDVLDEIELNIPADGPAEETKEWKKVERGIGFSTWDYTVRYRIVRTK